MHPKKPATVFFLLIAACAVTYPGMGQTTEQAAAPPVQASPAAQPEPTRARLPLGVMGGLLIKKVNPEYPKKARKEHVQGTVVLRAVITKEGEIGDLSVVSGDPSLAKSAVKAVKQWKYKPFMLEGKPVEVDTEIRVNFALSSG